MRFGKFKQIEKQKQKKWPIINEFILHIHCDMGQHEYTQCETDIWSIFCFTIDD